MIDLDWMMVCEGTTRLAPKALGLKTKTQNNQRNFHPFRSKVRLKAVVTQNVMCGASQGRYTEECGTHCVP